VCSYHPRSISIIGYTYRRAALAAEERTSMHPVPRGLGTQLRHLLEMLDGAVARVYEAEGLTYRPRFTPVMRALQQQEPLTIGQLARLAGITQPAATQTVALMVREGLVSTRPGATDARQRLVYLGEAGRALLPQLQRHWQATAGAAASLDAELPAPLSQVLESAIRALEAKPFEARIAHAQAQHAAPARPTTRRPTARKR
jgi:MarR family transcriptional regulator, organic hydroperoxide resistance regulator